MRSQCGHGMVAVRSRYGHGTVAVRSWFGHGMVAVQSRYSLGTLPIRSWYGTLKVRSRLLFSPRRASNLVQYMHYTIYCSQYGRGAVRYSLGTLPVRSWYGTLKDRSRLVFSTSLEPGIRMYALLFASHNRGLAGFGSASSDRDNKLSLS